MKLFVVPEGQKITEKSLYRVLIANICSILLCMAGLAGTTWAWFTVDIRNTDNLIQMGTPEIYVMLDDEELTAGTELAVGDHGIHLQHAGGGDSLSQKSTLYVTLVLDDTTYLYTALNYQNNYETRLTIRAERLCDLSWEVSWFVPANAELLTDDSLTIPKDKLTPIKGSASLSQGDAVSAEGGAAQGSEATQGSEAAQSGSEVLQGGGAGSEGGGAVQGSDAAQGDGAASEGTGTESGGTETTSEGAGTQGGAETSEGTGTQSSSEG